MGSGLPVRPLCGDRGPMVPDTAIPDTHAAAHLRSGDIRGI